MSPLQPPCCPSLSKQIFNAQSKFYLPGYYSFWKTSLLICCVSCLLPVCYNVGLTRHGYFIFYIVTYLDHLRWSIFIGISTEDLPWTRVAPFHGLEAQNENKVKGGMNTSFLPGNIIWLATSDSTATTSHWVKPWAKNKNNNNKPKKTQFPSKAFGVRY